MKKSSFFSKLLYFINSVVAAVLLVSYFLPYIKPKGMTSISILSLLVPILIILNVGFFIYWLIKLNKKVFLSGLILVIGWFVSSPLYKISEKKVLLNNDLKVMSYNVRLFNKYNWNKDKNTTQNILNLIINKDPDILAVQEFYEEENMNPNFKYKFIKIKVKNYGQAIYSKYPIINSGSLDLKSSSNNIIFADIVKHKDTFRVYNVHLESLRINPNKENFGQENSERLINVVSYIFSKQAKQVEKLIAHESSWKGKKIICGDFNNTAYSWTYKQIIKDKKDAFLEAGQGFGKSFNYPFPTRIDYILTDKSATINNFKTFSKKYSDHYPIMARLNWDEKVKN